MAMHRRLLPSRERVRLALEHRETDRIPIAMICSGINEPARTEFERHLQGRGGGPLGAYLDSILDVREVGPRYAGPPLPPGVDIWGVRRRPCQCGQATYDEIEFHPLAAAESVDDIVRHRWPSPDLYDYSVLPGRIAAAHRDGEHAILVSNGNIFETSWYMRGFEPILMDMVLNPDLAQAILDRVAAFYVEYFRRILEAARGEVDLVFTADDIGGQQGLLMSLPMWAEFIKPRHARLNTLIHEHGARVVYHSDGAVMEAIPGLMDMGIDVLQALQFDAAGMDARRMKELYGRRLCFAGGVSVQKTLPFGTPDQVREEVQFLVSTLGRHGGYILGPSHVIQAGTPPENVHALFETAINFYPFNNRS